jgi:catechol 2,3-dioxygenase-like lactoylglutathione lyase family enzyme
MHNPNPSETRHRPRLAMGHSTLAARDLEALQTFYCEVLGFEVSNRGPVGEDGLEIAFLSQDPGAHHQIAMVGGASTPSSDFVMVDPLAFRTRRSADHPCQSDRRRQRKYPANRPRQRLVTLFQ